MGTMLQLVIILVLSYHSCYGSSLEDPLYITTYYDIDDETSSVYNHAYPTYLGELNRDDFFPANELADRNRFSSYDDELAPDDGFSSNEIGSPSSSVRVINIDSFGANRNGDGTDAYEAFEKSWKEACSSSTGAVLILVPSNKRYLLKPIKFSGPCKCPITMMVYGTIEASADRADYRRDNRHWILFQNVQNLKIEGGGTFNGKGDIWWKNSCKIDKSRPCVTAPTALTFYQCQNLRVKNVRIRDSQQIHTSFERCLDVEAINLLISAPRLSPNTDGIHVGNTRRMQIRNCIIRTGAGKSEAHVSNILVDTARLTGTTNGVRIKTWQGGKGKANNIVFQNILMQNVTNPIIINQNYCDQADPCNEQESAVHVSSVVYKNIQGTSDTAVAVKYCSKSFPCSAVVLQDINLVREGGTQAKALCNDVYFDQLGKVFPKCP
ncbi:hypothetical protein C5167_006951 [Papaver somniferum]|uniref:Polygalacturonase n=1 Tax=Papaver somniferum TaxID=3469 RepID=A0A4Y7JJ10_PAPSO|nr:hypothetical protein C5167_006951 [Papaver somniferum]